jgi:hypothetical protein
MPESLEAGAAFHANLLRLWRAGRRDDVEHALARVSHVAFWRLLLEAVRIIRRHESTGVAAPPNFGAPEELVVLHAIVDFGHIECARAFVEATGATRPSPVGLANLRLLLLNLPNDPPGPPTAPFADNPDRDVQIVPCPGAECVLFVFTSGFHKFHVPLTLMHRWFRNLGVSVVYLRDFDRLSFLQGIRSLGDGSGAALRDLREIAHCLGATRIACIGSSSGSYGAMRYGLYLGASTVLCLAGPSVFDESIPNLLEQERQRGPFAQPIDTSRLDLAVLYGEAARTPRLRMIFGALHEGDATEAANMGELPNVELVALPQHASHAVVTRLVTDGTFQDHLRWVVETPAATEALSRMRERAG